MNATGTTACGGQCDNGWCALLSVCGGGTPEQCGCSYCFAFFANALDHQAQDEGEEAMPFDVADESDSDGVRIMICRDAHTKTQKHTHTHTHKYIQSIL